MGPTEFHILFFFSSLSFLFLGNFFYFVLCNFCFIFYFGQRNYCISSSINLNRLNILCFITLIYIKTKYKIKSHLADPQNQKIYIYISYLAFDNIFFWFYKTYISLSQGKEDIMTILFRMFGHILTSKDKRIHVISTFPTCRIKKKIVQTMLNIKEKNKQLYWNGNNLWKCSK